MFEFLCISQDGFSPKIIILYLLKNNTINTYFQNSTFFFSIIDACKDFSATVATAFGPNGMNKMVINHLEKLFVTNDAATIIRELEVEHPAAKMMILGSQMMEQEVGDGTNFVIVLAGALLKEAEDLVRLF